MPPFPLGSHLVSTHWYEFVVGIFRSKLFDFGLKTMPSMLQGPIRKGYVIYINVEEKRF